ncbi:MAG TPA: adenylosuccinate lyase [Caulobacteraceae bacterium]|nr:adenylosuccinate lyase [Caulobacteraceae bacterium]
MSLDKSAGVGAGLALSPLDGRYRRATQPVAELMSEFSLMRHRVRVEVEWLVFLSRDLKLPELPALADDDVARLRALYETFGPAEFEAIAEIERVTNHDVKAVEYFLKDRTEGTAVHPYREFIHFACTSEDINNLAYGLMLKGAIDDVWIPKLEALCADLEARAVELRDARMLAHTHGQPATPTTLGKEFAVFAYRLRRQLKAARELAFLGKINGATGTFSAHAMAYPDVDWLGASRRFVESLGLEHNPLTTQIEPHDYISEACDLIARVDTIATNISVDMWLYISLGYFSQALVKGEVGSSTMPHKVNPIDFENAEANFGVANALLRHLSGKLPISRLQRDLSDSSAIRSLGSAIGYSCQALDALMRGLKKLRVSEARLAEDLDGAWEVLGEGLQTVMRKAGAESPYERMKALTRGEPVGPDTFREIILGLDLPQAEKDRLLALTPRDYVGRACDLVGVLTSED